MTLSSLASLVIKLIDSGNLLALAPPYDHVLGMFFGWIFSWFCFGVIISIVSNIILWRILKWQFVQFIGGALVMALGSLVGAIIAGISLLYLGYNIGFIGGFSISGALLGLLFATSRWFVLRRYWSHTGRAVLISVCGWALGWSTWYLPNTFSTETVLVIGFGMVAVVEALILIWLYRKRQILASEGGDIEVGQP